MNAKATPTRESTITACLPQCQSSNGVQRKDEWILRYGTIPRFALMLLAIMFCVFHATAQTPSQEKASQDALETALSSYSDGKYLEAEGILTNAIAKLGDRSEFFYWLGCAAFKQGKLDSALTAFKRFCELDPSKAEGPRWVADVYAKQHKFPLAVMWYEKALKIDGNDTQAKTGLEAAKKVATPESPAYAPIQPQANAPANSVEPKPSPGSEKSQPLDTTSHHWNRIWSTGVVGYVDEKYRTWAFIGGAVVLLWLTIRNTGRLVQKFRPPLNNQELAKLWWSNMFWGYLFYVGLCGTSSKLWLIVGAIGIFVLANFMVAIARFVSAAHVHQQAQARGILSYLIKKAQDESKDS